MCQSKEQLSAEQLLRIVLDTIPLRVFWKDLDLNFLGANQKLLDDIGFNSLDDLIGESDYAIFETPEEAEPKRDDDREVIQSGEAKLDIEEALPIQGKRLKWLRTNKVPMKMPDGKIIGVLGTYQDITAEVEYRQLIERQALIDPLTELANRRNLQNQILESEYILAGLLFIDLDRFKHINDTLGHSVGDILLQTIAKRFQEIADTNDAMLARLGGDEFSIFKTFDDHSKIKDTLESIAKSIINVLNKPIHLGHHVVSIGASIGITTINGYNKSTKDGFTEADLAMYSAKINGRNNYRFYTEDLGVSAKRLHNLYSYLHHAIANNELYLVYQAQFNATNTLIGAEALVRWNNPKLGQVSPDEFIPIAEESGMIHELGEWVIREALDTLVSWKSWLALNPEFKLAVNVSSKQLEHRNLTRYIKNNLSDRGLNAKHVEIEITESLLLEQKTYGITSMGELKEIGVNIAIDDFGTGYSSLSYLAALPLNKLKIDRSFVSGLHTNDTNKKLVETMIKLASGLGLNVIAEGVETLDEKYALESLGCTEFQGFLFSKPISAAEFERQYLSKGI